jgi:2-hydroxy-3-keto-5-methylthiopentenyl-1-phosphate phosphatase
MSGPGAVVFLDFDGTITLRDASDAILDAFADPEWGALEAVRMMAEHDDEATTRRTGAYFLAQIKDLATHSTVRTGPRVSGL